MMDKGGQKSFVSNVMIILAAQAAVKVLGMFYRMVITNIDGFGDAGNGFYSAGFQIYTLLLALSSVGIPNAIAKLIAEKAALSDIGGADRIFKAARRTKIWRELPKVIRYSDALRRNRKKCSLRLCRKTDIRLL